MKKNMKATIMILCMLGIIYGIVATIIGSLSIVYHPYIHKTSCPYGMNDVTQIMVSNDGYIYTLGRSLLQRFDSDGKFCDGVYFSVGGKRVEVKGHGELLSLSNGNIIVFSIDDSKICGFDNEFNLLFEKKDVNSLNYFSKDYYKDYPNTDVSDMPVKLSLFSNVVEIGGKKVTLDAPRNMWFSYLVGVPVLILSAIIFVLIKFHKEEIELKELRKKYGIIKPHNLGR